MITGLVRRRSCSRYFCDYAAENNKIAHMLSATSFWPPQHGKKSAEYRLDKIAKPNRVLLNLVLANKNDNSHVFFSYEMFDKKFQNFLYLFKFRTAISLYRNFWKGKDLLSMFLFVTASVLSEDVV